MRSARAGYGTSMSQTPDEERTEERIEGRSDLLPEEEAVGSDDPHDQAEEILRESDERTEHPEETGEESVQTSSTEERPGIG